MKKILIAVVLLAIVGAGAYFFISRKAAPAAVIPAASAPIATSTVPAATTTAAIDEKQTVIGKSADGRDIVAYHYGASVASTTEELLFVGGIHGGYSWNTAKVAYEAMDYLGKDATIPEGVRVTVVPVLNPDGLSKVLAAEKVGGSFGASDVNGSESARVAGRFNGNTVDLNRNFDCDWQQKGTWQSKTVDGGDAAFSEPESQAIKSYVEARDIAGAIVWYSSAGGVFASNCHDGVLPETASLVKTYSAASGYAAHEEFDFYEVTGDLTNWLAKRGTPAISVLLTTHEDTEWSKNQKGIAAVLASFAE